MATNLYIKTSDATRERIAGVPAGSYAEFRAFEATFYPKWDALYRAANAVEPDSAAYREINAEIDRIDLEHEAIEARIGEVAREVGKVSGKAWAYINAHGLRDPESDYAGEVTTREHMLGLLSAQREGRYSNEGTIYFGGTPDEWKRCELSYKRWMDKVMLAVGDGRITCVYWC